MSLTSLCHLEGLVRSSLRRIFLGCKITVEKLEGSLRAGKGFPDGYTKANVLTRGRQDDEEGMKIASRVEAWLVYMYTDFFLLSLAEYIFHYESP